MPSGNEDGALLAFFRRIAEQDIDDLDPRATWLAFKPITVAASRQDAKPFYLDSIEHYVYAGDTALHIAAAAYRPTTAELLVGNGANVRARNRRGAEPLHYAADGIPGAPHWNPAGQQAVIDFLVTSGAEPNALDKSGVAPLHRAVRTRCAAAVHALLENGANPQLKNKSGSTPLDLAVQNTGRTDSASVAAKEQQREIIDLLLRYAAQATDTATSADVDP